MADIWVAHIHAGGCDACLREWESAWQAIGPGWRLAADPAEAVVLVVTGVPNELGAEPLRRVLAAWAADGPGTLVLAGDCAINGGLWAKLGAPGVLPGVDTAALPAAITVHPIPGDPPAPAAILDGLRAAMSNESRAMSDER
jgi:Ni,Fe-hydrogenase III small subunit